MSFLNSGYRISEEGEMNESEQALDGSELLSGSVKPSSCMKLIISCPFSVAFSGVKTLLMWLMFGEAAESGEGGSEVEKGSSAMVKGGCH